MRHSGKRSASPARLYRGAGAAFAVVALLSVPAEGAQMLVPRIDSFGPYKLGMTLEQAKAAHKGAKLGACGEVASDRQCLVLDAAIFDEPGIIYAVFDTAGAKIERIVAQLDPQRTQRRSYRCVRLSEKVFALLAVVYGSKFKQSYDESRRPLPAVAWDGEIFGRLIFETKCRTADEGNPRISIVAHQPEGVAPPKVAEQAAPKPVALPPGNALPPALSSAQTLTQTPAVASAPAPAVPRGDGALSIEAPAINPQGVAELPASISLAVPDAAGRATLGPEAPVPASAPIGVVEEIRPDTGGAVAADAAMTALTRELAQAKGKKPLATPSAAARLAPPTAAAAKLNVVQTAAQAPAQPARPRYSDELPEPPDMVAPEPFMVPEEEKHFRQRRDAATPPSSVVTASPSPAGAASAPLALLSVSPPTPRAHPKAQPRLQAAPQRPEPAPFAPISAAAPARTAAAAAPADSKPAARPESRSLVPVLTGGWRHRAPVPPARPWRERTDTAVPGGFITPP